jgi:hypothetical protein
MRYTQLTSDLRRDHVTPKQIGRTHAALFHALEITPKATPGALPNSSVLVRL